MSIASKISKVTTLVNVSQADAAPLFSITPLRYKTYLDKELRAGVTKEELFSPDIAFQLELTTLLKLLVSALYHW